MNNIFVPKAPKQKPKHEKCAGRFRYCDPDSELVKLEICGALYQYCRPCMAELDESAKKSVGMPFVQKQYSTSHGEPVKAYKKRKLGRLGL